MLLSMVKTAVFGEPSDAPAVGLLRARFTVTELAV